MSINYDDDDWEPTEEEDSVWYESWMDGLDEDGFPED